MNAAHKPGLGNVSSTRPQSRAERRAEAERLRVEQEQDTTGSSDTAPAAELPAAAPADTTRAVQLPLKRAKKKVPIATQIRRETETRIEWAQAQGAALTDLVDAALTAYLDAAGVPQPGPDGTIAEAP
ncbi:hypothetical protein AB0C65_38290 [Nocardia sp. NPDC048505]|uniref:hypothetical protein n=1 Tax=Nocardia sp. NPDC048505 TaxID=3155756 RepID=UPI0033D0CBFE